jgi:HK97 family phage prohead protease
MSALLDAPVAQLQRAVMPFRQARTSSEGGVLTVEGYLVTYGEVNQNGWLWVPGAARDSLKQRRDAGRALTMGYQHDLFEALQVIGVWPEPRDSVDGVYASGRISDTQTGRDAATLVQDGAITGISVGFLPLQYQFLEPGQRADFDTPYGRFSYQVEEWAIAVIQAGVSEASLVHEPADEAARIDSFTQSLEKAQRAMPGLLAGADAAELQYSMAVLMGGRGAGAFEDLGDLEHRGLYQRLAAGYAKHGLTPPEYSRHPNYRDVAFQHDERQLFQDRYLRKGLAGVVAGATGFEGPLSPETREEADRAIEALQELRARRSDSERLSELAASLRQTTQTLKEKSTHHGT